MRTSTIIASAIALALGALPSMAATTRVKRDTPQCNLASNSFPCADASAACELIQDKLLGLTGSDGNGPQDILAETNQVLVVGNSISGVGAPTTVQAQAICKSIVTTCCPNGGNMTKASAPIGGQEQVNIQIISLLDR